MENTYTRNNVEAMIDAVKSNSEIIKSMLKTANDNGRLINSRLSDYALTKSALSEKHIEMYRDYSLCCRDTEKSIREYMKNIGNADGRLMLSANIENMDDDISIFHAAFEFLNKVQIGIMEMLCALIGKGNMVLASI